MFWWAHLGALYCNQGLRCTACLSVLKQYRLLSDLEVLASLPCPGVRTGRTGCGHLLLHKVHFTHTMDGIESTLTCRSCGAKLTGHCKGLSRKLLLPCGTSALRLQRRRLWFGLQFFCQKNVSLCPLKSFGDENGLSEVSVLWTRSTLVRICCSHRLHFCVSFILLWADAKLASYRNLQKMIQRWLLLIAVSSVSDYYTE